MINVAILGYGVVGSGVLEVMQMRKESIKKKTGEEVAVKKILDIRDFSGDENANLFTKDFDEILNDDSIKIVVETIGGATFAYDFTKKALLKGKNVVTSNKELVATYGPELLRLAKENNVSYLFEASVGGGIPIIRPMTKCLLGNEIQWIKGILNGTTNYILTSMNNDSIDFDVALKQAQEKGYAEANPEADVEGYDARRKIAILSSIAYDIFVDSDKIYTKGITAVEPVDFYFANLLGYSIKLIGQSEKLNGKIFARVSPAMVSNDEMLSNVEDVFNAIVVSGDALGEAIFYGQGAGKLPTASAVVADVIEAVKHVNKNLEIVWNIPSENILVDIDDVEESFYIRVDGNKEKATRVLKELFDGLKFIEAEDVINTVAVVTEKTSYKEMNEKEEKLKEIGNTLVLPFA